jgi:rhodanese-related sulfurtransferase
MDEDDFLALVTVGQPAAPDYFVYDAVLNRRVHEVFDPAHHARPLDLAEAIRLQEAGAVVVDARDPQEFAAGHLAGSLNVPADGRFAETAGTVVQPEVQIVVVAPQDREEEIVIRLARIGFDQVAGYLREPEGAFLDAPERIVRASRITAPQLAAVLRTAQPPVLIDVRNPGELAEGAIVGARHIPLAQLSHRLDEIPPDRPVVTYCAGGYRSSVAASLLRRAGIADVSDVLGGYGAWAALAQPVS